MNFSFSILRDGENVEPCIKRRNKAQGCNLMLDVKQQLLVEAILAAVNSEKVETLRRMIERYSCFLA
jgi:hypothetical protein